MKKSTQACIIVTVLMLAAVSLIIFGKNVLNTGMGFVLEYKYIDALIPKEGSSVFYPETVLWLRTLFVTGILAALLIWLRKKWSTVVTLILCLSSVIIRMYGNAKHGYSPFTFDDTAEMLMMLLPFLAAGLCVWLLRLPPENTETETEENTDTQPKQTAPERARQAEPAASAASDDLIDLNTVLDKEEIRLLSTDLSCLADKLQTQGAGTDEVNVVRTVCNLVSGTGVIPKQALNLCVLAVQDTVDSVASTFGLSMGGHNALLEKLQKLQE